jgi:hypothetical protein
MALSLWSLYFIPNTKGLPGCLNIAPVDDDVNLWMYSYTDVGGAHAELLLVTCVKKENPLGNKNLFLSVSI